MCWVVWLLHFCWGIQHVGWNVKNILHSNNINKVIVFVHTTFFFLLFLFWLATARASFFFPFLQSAIAHILLLPIPTAIVDPFIFFFLFLWASSSSSYDTSSFCHRSCSWLFLAVLLLPPFPASSWFFFFVSNKKNDIFLKKKKNTRINNLYGFFFVE